MDTLDNDYKKTTRELIEDSEKYLKDKAGKLNTIKDELLMWAKNSTEYYEFYFRRNF